MTERYNRIDELSSLLAVTFVEKMKPNGIKYEDIAESIVDCGYQRVSEGDIIIHKDPTKRTEKEIEWLVNHNKAVRKEVAKKIFWYLNDEWDHNPWHFVDWLKEEFGVEIKK